MSQIDSTDFSNKTRVVTFNRKVRIKRTLTLDKYSSDEIKDCFYTRSDVQQFSRSTRKRGKFLESNETDSSEGTMFRGAESHTRTAKSKKRTRWSRASEIVQEWQAKNPSFMVARLVSESFDSIKEAYLRGLNDEIEVARLYPEEGRLTSSIHQEILHTSNLPLKESGTRPSFTKEISSAPKIPASFFSIVAAV